LSQCESFSNLRAEILGAHTELRPGLIAARYAGRASLTPNQARRFQKGQQWHENRSDLG